MRSFVCFSALLLVTASAVTAQTASKPRVRAGKPSSAVSAREVQELRDALAAQQQQMQQQRQQMEQLKSQLQQLLEASSSPTLLRKGCRVPPSRHKRPPRRRNSQQRKQSGWPTRLRLMPSKPRPSFL